MTEAMPFLQKYDITFLRPPTIRRGIFIRGFLQNFQIAGKSGGGKEKSLPKAGENTLTDKNIHGKIKRL